MNVTFTCSTCGPTVLELPDDYTDESHAKCKKCGADFGPYGEIKKRAMDEAKKEVTGMFKDAMRKAGWKTN